MLTREDVFDSMREELSEMEANLRKSEKNVDDFLSRFDDLDKFFISANEIVEYYFNNQNKYNNIENYKKYLKEQLEFYIHSFSIDLSTKMSLIDELYYIEEKYDKLIYFWIYNPIENRRQKEKINKKTEWQVWFMKWIIGKLLK